MTKVKKIIIELYRLFDDHAQWIFDESARLTKKSGFWWLIFLKDLFIIIRTIIPAKKFWKIRSLPMVFQFTLTVMYLLFYVRINPTYWLKLSIHGDFKYHPKFEHFLQQIFVISWVFQTLFLSVWGSSKLETGISGPDYMQESQWETEYFTFYYYYLRLEKRASTRWRDAMSNDRTSKTEQRMKNNWM